MADPAAHPPSPHRGHLPRLAPEFYRGFAVVHWVMTVDRRATGWLDALRHAQFREALLHTMVRYDMLCPTYCLMPDHAHFVWMGIAPLADQRSAATFCRRATNRLLAPENGNVSPTLVCCGRSSENTGRFNRCVTTCGKIPFAPAWPQPRTTTPSPEPSCRAFQIWTRAAKISGAFFGRSTTRRWNVPRPRRNRRGYLAHPSPHGLPCGRPALAYSPPPTPAG